MMRLNCVVPGCRRTTGRYPDSNEWICATHWPLVDRQLKLLRTKCRRRWERKVAIAKFAEEKAYAEFNAHFGEGGPGTFRTVDYEAHYKAGTTLRRAERSRGRAEWAIWRRMKRQAIERAAGL